MTKALFVDDKNGCRFLVSLALLIDMTVCRDIGLLFWITLNIYFCVLCIVFCIAFLFV